MADYQVDPEQRNFPAYYQLEKKLGAGAFATVWKAKSLETGKVFAVKQIRKSFIKQKNMQREIQIMRAIAHPNVLSMYDAFEDNVNIYLVLQLATRGDVFGKLEEHANNNTVFPEPEAKDIIAQVVMGVKYLHDNGIAHRDLKCENLLLDSSEDTPTGLLVLVADFGLSRLFTDNEFQQMTTKVGSLEYCAPDVLSGRPYSNAVDLWSIGVITYCLVTGCFPFFSSSRNPSELSAKINAVSYTWEGFEYVSDEAKDFVGKLLVKDPAARLTAEQALEHPWLRQ